MRSDKSSINQLLMCMSKPQTGDHSGPYPPMKVEPAIMTTSSDNSRTSYEDNDVIAFGPIKVKPRKRPAPTLATGRRSKYECLPPEEEARRDLRRKRNREAAERVRLSRLAVEQQLQEQIENLEKTQKFLETNVQNLENHKLELETRLRTHQQFCPTTNFPPVHQPQQFMLPTNLIDSNQQFSFDQLNSVGSIQNFDKEFDFDFPEPDFESLLNDEMPTEINDDFLTDLFPVN